MKCQLYWSKLLWRRTWEQTAASGCLTEDPLFDFTNFSNLAESIGQGVRLASAPRSETIPLVGSNAHLSALEPTKCRQLVGFEEATKILALDHLVTLRPNDVGLATLDCKVCGLSRS
jgi:hypothetical protein